MGNLEETSSGPANRNQFMLQLSFEPHREKTVVRVSNHI